MSRLQSENVTLTYDVDPVVVDLSVAIQDGAITTIIGPNGCGKSTLLRALSRLLKPTSGAVLLDGELIHRLPTRSVALRLGLLSQQSTPPGNITIEDLIRRGRYPHQGVFQRPSKQDDLAVEHALDLAEMTDLHHHQVDRLSGGQRQRTWFAMSLVQDTSVMILDVPTTFLDLSAQIELLDIAWELNRDHCRTVVMVMHDLNLATRYADHLIAMKRGKVIAECPPEQIVTADLIKQVFDIDANVIIDPLTGTPLTIPTTANGHFHQPMSVPTQAGAGAADPPLFLNRPMLEFDPAAAFAQSPAPQWVRFFRPRPFAST